MADGSVSGVSETKGARVIKPRSPGLDFDEPLPRYWFAGNAVATHIANGVNLLFPAGERFFVRSVHHYLDQIQDPDLRAQVKGFFGQEGRHAKEHERQMELLRAEGFSIDRFLALYERIAYGLIEKLAPPALCLSATAACEHFTAIMAENALRMRIIDRAHPTMRKLLLWHAAEEIEHRAVAFDVLRQVNPSYALRMAGLAMATACLGGFWVLGTTALLATDPEVDMARVRADLKAAKANRAPGTNGAAQDVFLRGIREYMRPDFHPSQSDVDALADEYLRAEGLA